MTEPARKTPFADREHGHKCRRSVLTIGTFDGVHAGHRALLERAATMAERCATGRARVIALAFDPHPLEALAPERAPARLTTWPQRERLLREAGAEEVVRLEPTPALLSLSPAEFIEQLARDYRPAGIVEGTDFHFGAKRAGDIEMLRSLGAAHDFVVDIVDQVQCALNDHTIAPASSSLVRWLISRGRVSDAARILGRPYRMDGIVRRGDRRGRTINYPTANIESPCLAPADGVYAGRAHLPDGRLVAAAISVGTKPTFDGRDRAVEAYLMDADASATGRSGAWDTLPGLPEYEWDVGLEFLAFVRDQVRFDTLEELLAQMARDCEACRAIAETAALCEAAHKGA
ncbi:MAG: bifunctional riboflavin kinase/FMN adenylyltransferase [Phycisphaeraceae bacterium]|nr:bifunctional riboflavin kinase/FMN adenylyltransferase [Phycisphaeraceae bacterium]